MRRLLQPPRESIRMAVTLGLAAPTDCRPLIA